MPAFLPALPACPAARGSGGSSSSSSPARPGPAPAHPQATRPAILNAGAAAIKTNAVAEAMPNIALRAASARIGLKPPAATQPATATVRAAVGARARSCPTLRHPPPAPHAAPVAG
jgi:hypothetical protein